MSRRYLILRILSLPFEYRKEWQYFFKKFKKVFLAGFLGSLSMPGFGRIGKKERADG